MANSLQVPLEGRLFELSDRASLLVISDFHIGMGDIYDKDIESFFGFLVSHGGQPLEVEGVPSSAPVRPDQDSQPPKIKTKIPNPMDDWMFMSIDDNEGCDMGPRNLYQLRKGDN